MKWLIFVIALIMMVSCRERLSPADESGHPENTLIDIKVSATRGDSLFFEEVMHNILSRLGPSADVSRRMAEAGRAFLKTPYVASTLEAEGDEHLVINLLGVDCTTFVEYVTAMVLCSIHGLESFGDFVRLLTDIRYRGGRIDGYPSRLHYFTDWLKDNETKGYITIISDNTGDEVLDTEVGFMTSNPQYYRQLQENPAFLEKMSLLEKEISGYEMRYISKDMIDQKARQIFDGDIIAFVTAIGGLDVSHTGLAIHQEGKLHLLHASSRSGEVEITAVPLSGYLKDNRNVPGILVARVITED